MDSELLEFLEGIFKEEDDTKDIQSNNDDIDTLPRDCYQITKLLKEFELPCGCNFKIGDFVIPKENSNIRRKGEPGLVISVYDTCQYQNHELSLPLRPYNMIIARAVSDNLQDIKLYLAYSDDYELYKGITFGEYETEE